MILCVTDLRQKRFEVPWACFSSWIILNYSTFTYYISSFFSNVTWQSPWQSLSPKHSFIVTSPGRTGLHSRAITFIFRKSECYRIGQDIFKYVKKHAWFVCANIQVGLILKKSFANNFFYFTAGLLWLVGLVIIHNCLGSCIIMKLLCLQTMKMSWVPMGEWEILAGLYYSVLIKLYLLLSPFLRFFLLSFPSRRGKYA